MVGERQQKAQDLLKRITGSSELQRKWQDDPLSLLREHGLGEHESNTEENSVVGAAAYGMSKEDAAQHHRDHAGEPARGPGASAQTGRRLR